MTNTNTLLRLGAASLVIVAVAACNDLTTGPSSSMDARVAITQREGAQPTLYVGNLDGSVRTRIHFANVVDSIPGNLQGRAPNDTNLIALGSPSLSPTGDRIAVVATLAADQSEIVVMGMKDTGEVASINTQIIASAPEWSPDGTKLAYVMSTLPGFGGLDLFVTDLKAHTVTRMTTAGNIGNAAITWSADGSVIYYSRTTRMSSDLPSNWLSEVVAVNVQSKAAQTIATDVVGQITAVSRTGARALVTRSVAQSGDTSRVLYEAALGASTADRLLGASGVAYAHYLTGSDSYAVIVVATSTGGSVSNIFLLADLQAGVATPIANVSGESGNANVDAALLRTIH